MDRRELQGTFVGAEYPRHIIRRFTPDDMEWLFGFIFDKYEDPYSIDRVQGAEYLYDCMKSSNWLVLRGKRSFGMCLFENVPFSAKRIGVIYLLAAENGKDWESYYLLGNMIKWLRENGCMLISASAETEFNIAPFMKRFGGKECKTYVIETKMVH